MGRRGGRAKASTRFRRMAREAAALPPLRTPADAMERLELIGRLAVAGVLSGSQAGAAVRSCEVWLRGIEAFQDRERMEQLERHIEELERELARARQRGGA